MTRSKWFFSGLLGALLLACLLAGCAKEPTMPLAPSASDPGTVTQDSTGMSNQPPAGGTGRLDERDRNVVEGRMSGDSTAADPAAAREVFLSDDVLFDYNSFTLTDDAKRLLEQKAKWMAQHPDVTVQLEGHCDERGTVAYNLALGERRANAVWQYMTALGVGADRMTTISYGEEFPLDPRHDEEAWARNRRAHFAILNP